jgi:hypothetical protein
MALVHVATEIDPVISDRVLDLIAEEVHSRFEGVAGFHTWRAGYLTGR